MKACDPMFGRTKGTGKHNVYVFPLQASVRDADGLTARMRIAAESVGKVEFTN